MSRYGREDEENGRLAAAEALRTEASLAEDGIKTMAAPSSAASTSYSSVAQLPAAAPVALEAVALAATAVAAPRPWSNPRRRAGGDCHGALR